ncbi:SMI1/KNR4 family protein [Paraburkholderia tropica]|uniref:SMI1-KNR4 cell-wall n=1 Tax=Paraburkholderia tropica TaxID=92647 RepID=A0AAQ1GCS7_9BURK|nr:SMI1/KNR4 family protein [Paraburkholderia tropica]RQN39708.1 SMI1/KNR4 family protein [Paraburkholderia tropica]SEJ22862.1 SMI1-KNR4 cell-wall [Paraburkholderia tropica]
MRYEDTEQSLSANDLDAFEHVTKIRLPEAFKRHYLGHNGGYPVDVERVVGLDHVFPFHGFFPLKYGALTIEMMKKDLAEDFGLSDAIPFAYDQGSNIFYIATTCNDCGAVLQITADTKDIFFVCNSFDQFLNGLQVS